MDDRRKQALDFAIKRRGCSDGGTVPHPAEHSADDIFARAHSAVEDHIQQFARGGTVKPAQDDVIGHATARAIGRGAAAMVLGDLGPDAHDKAKRLGRGAADSLTDGLKFAKGGTVPEVTIDPIDVDVPKQTHVEVGEVKMPGDVDVTVGQPELGSVFEGSEAADKRLGGRELGLQDDPVGNGIIAAAPGLATSAVRGVVGAVEGRAAQAAAAAAAQRAAAVRAQVALNQNIAKAAGSGVGEFAPSAGAEAVTGARALPKVAAAAPGEAVYQGKLPAARQAEQAAANAKWLAEHEGADPVQKFDRGGTVQPRVQVGIGDIRVEPAPGIELGTPVITDAAPVPVVTPEAAPANVAPAGPAAISQQIPPDADPTTTRLADIEGRRERALADTDVSTGDRVGRGIAAGLSAFGGGTPTDFDARDRARRAEINAGAEGERHRALAAPGEAAARAALDPNSQASKRLSLLASRVAPGLDLSGLSADEVGKALPLVTGALAAIRAGDTLTLQQKKLELDTLIRHDQVANQKEANSIRLLDVMMKKRGLDQTQSKDIMAMLAGARTDPMTRQAYTDYGNIRKAEGILSKGHGYTPFDIVLLGGEMAKIATGGVPDQHTLGTLTPETAHRQLAEWYTGVTGRPAPAGMDALVNEAFGPYLADLKRKVGGSLAGSAARTMKLAGPNVPPHIKALLADPGALVDMMDAGAQQYEDSHGGPGAPASPEDDIDPDHVGVLQVH